MKKLLLLILLCASVVSAQGTGGKGGWGGKGGFGGGANALLLNPGWVSLQGSTAVAGSTCSSGGNTCAQEVLIPTTSGSVVIVGFGGSSASQIKISSICGTTGTFGTCSGTNDGFTLVSGSACAVFDSHDGWSQDCAYSTSVPSGTKTIIATLSGNMNGGGNLAIEEIMPPSGYTASFDVAGAVYSGSACTSCTGVNLSTLAGTDAVVQFSSATLAGVDDSCGIPFAPWSSPYVTDVMGDGLLLNSSTAPTPTFTQANVSAGVGCSTTPFFVGSAIAFKSSAGTFVVPAPLFSLVSINEPLISSAINTEGTVCHTTCTITFANQNGTWTSGSGHLLYLVESNTTGGSGHSLSSVTGGGTWVVPAGCAAGISSNGELSCAYALSSTSGTSALNIGMSANSTSSFVLYEISRSSGSFVLDTLGATVNAATNTQYLTGQPLTLGLGASANDVMFQSVFDEGAVEPAFNYYPYYLGPITGSTTPFAGYGFGNEFFYQNSNSIMLLNSNGNPANTNTPMWIANGTDTATTVVNGAAFK